MGNGRFDLQGALIDSLEAFCVFLCCVHLNLKRVDLEKLCALLQIFGAVLILAGFAQLLNDAGNTQTFALIQVHLAELEVRLEPEALVAGLSQCCQCRLVKVEEQIRLLRIGHVVENRVDGLLRVVARNCTLDVREQLLVGHHHLREPLQLEEKLARLLEGAEAPFALLRLQRHNATEGGESLVGLRLAQLLGAVVEVLEVGIFLVVVLRLVFKVVVLLARVAHEVIVGHGGSAGDSAVVPNLLALSSRLLPWHSCFRSIPACRVASFPMGFATASCPMRAQHRAFSARSRSMQALLMRRTTSRVSRTFWSTPSSWERSSIRPSMTPSNYLSSSACRRWPIKMPSPSSAAPSSPSAARMPRRTLTSCSTFSTRCCSAPPLPTSRLPASAAPSSRR
eukprot:m.78008 g.78008  ORF g.78008 m.78008 type:complete len:395 (+) comp8152_c2_seq3:2120-3304(+)